MDPLIEYSRQLDRGTAKPVTKNEFRPYAILNGVVLGGLALTGLVSLGMYIASHPEELNGLEKMYLGF